MLKYQALCAQVYRFLSGYSGKGNNSYLRGWGEAERPGRTLQGETRGSMWALLGMQFEPGSEGAENRSWSLWGDLCYWPQCLTKTLPADFITGDSCSKMMASKDLKLNDSLKVLLTIVGFFPSKYENLEVKNKWGKRAVSFIDIWNII